MGFKPLGKRVLIERLEEVKTTASGIIIPDNAKEKPLTGKVVAVSSKIADKKDLAVGDTVFFGKYAGTEVLVNGRDYLVMTIDDILGILN
jgi:chaperonin GroES